MIVSPSFPLAAGMLALLIGSAALAQGPERVNFASGNDNTAVEASVTGNDVRDFLGAAAWQTMSVSLSTEGNAYFNIRTPGSQGEAIFNGSIDGPDATFELPADGDYTIRVYLMGGDADGGRVAVHPVHDDHVRLSVVGQLLAMALAAALCASGQAASAQEVRTEQVRFDAGRNGATIRGGITGRESVSYIVGAEAGQRMEVALDASNGATYFNVTGPGPGRAARRSRSVN